MNDTIIILGEEGDLLLSQAVLRNLTRSVLIPAAIFVVLLALAFIGSKIKHRVFRGFLGIAALCVAAGIMLFSSSPGSTFVSNLTLAFVMTAVVFILNFIKLSALDYVVTFACFTCISRFAGFDLSFWGISLTFLYVFTVLLAVYKIRLKRLNGQLFYIWFSFMLSALEGYICAILFDNYVRPIGYALSSDAEKLFVWGIASLIIIAVNFALIYAIKRFFGKYFQVINQMGKTYPRIERFFIYNSVGILLLMILLNFGYVLVNGFDNMPTGVFTMFSLFALVIQLSFLIMIFRITWLKDSLQSKMLESRNLADYSSNLERNMDDIRNIKHDIKNIFLTMGNFVERSGNADMKDFYHEKISPFASGEIAKNDIYGKLIAINNEPLKAFLYYKISQAVERGIALDLDIAPYFSVSEISMDVVDLVRILGVLLDNAIEECMSLPHGVITIKLSQKDEISSLLIKNTINSEKKALGIKTGASSKGDNRGRGLMIVKRILGKYDCVTLNSYFQNDCFVQNIVTYQFGQNDEQEESRIGE